VQVEQAAILAWLDEQHTAATLREIAEHSDISQHSARQTGSSHRAS
jgi:DNA-directed RNA polymerase sigma subunit (sigma70/sigma32)